MESTQFRSVHHTDAWHGDKPPNRGSVIAYERLAGYFAATVVRPDGLAPRDKLLHSSNRANGL